MMLATLRHPLSSAYHYLTDDLEYLPGEHDAISAAEWLRSHPEEEL